MKFEVNGTNYDIEIIGDKEMVNGKEMGVKLNEDEITIRGNIFRLDFVGGAFTHDNKWDDLYSLKELGR